MCICVVCRARALRANPFLYKSRQLAAHYVGNHTLLQSYGFFLFALFVIAAVASCLETGSNPFIAQLGSPTSAERRLNFSQAFNPLGSMAGLLIGTIFIFSGIELKPGEVNTMRAANQYMSYLHMEVMRCVRPYMLLSGVALLWSALILISKFPSERVESTTGMGAKGRLRDLLNYPHFHFAVLARFMYVGAQVATWSYFIQYVQAYGHQSEKVAGYLLT
jgi:FHS family L-fucose permease-like MFS transporter